MVLMLLSVILNICFYANPLQRQLLLLTLGIVCKYVLLSLTRQILGRQRSRRVTEKQMCENLTIFIVKIFLICKSLGASPGDGGPIFRIFWKVLLPEGDVLW